MSTKLTVIQGGKAPLIQRPVPPGRMTTADAMKLGCMCDLCPCSKGRLPPLMVPPTFAASPKFVVVGEGPGRVEESQGAAFIGPTGQFLNRLLQEARIDRSQGHITNVALCRADSDKDNQRAAECCTPRLVDELAKLPADIPILTAGKAALKAVLGTSKLFLARGFYWKVPEIDDSVIRSLRRKIEKKPHPEFLRRALTLEGRQKLSGRVVLPTVHPAYVLRADTWQPILQADIRKFGGILRGELTEANLDNRGKYSRLRTLAKVDRALQRLGPEVAIDIETDSTNPNTVQILCVGISDGERTVVIEPWWPDKHRAILTRALAKRRNVFHNGVNFDIIALQKDGVRIEPRNIEDTLLAHHTIGSHFPQRLDHCVSVYLWSEPWKIKFGRKGQEEKGIAPRNMPRDQLCLYNAADARLTIKLWRAMQDDLTPHLGVYEHDKALAAIAATMIKKGIGVNVPHRNSLAVRMARKSKGLRDQMRRLTGNPKFNPQRHADVRTALFGQFKAPLRALTPTGLASTASGTLEVFRGNGTKSGLLSGLVLDDRSVIKSKSTYIDALSVEHVQGLGPRIRANWKVYATPNGRWGSRMQSLPRIEKDSDGKLILESRVREFYVPRKGCVFVHFDLKQAEAHAAARLSGDPNFIETCKGDVHIGNGCIVFPDHADVIRSDPKGLGKKFRDIAKNCGYGIMYLAEAETIHKFILAKGFKTSLRAVQAMLNLLRKAYRVYFRYVDKNVAWCHHNGYLVSPIMKRVRWMGFFAKPSEVANCLDAETEALTERGWVAGFDLKLGDRLLTKNGATGELEWHAMTDLKLFPKYRGPLIEFKSKTFNALTTPAHRWWVTDRQYKIDRVATSEELAKGDGRLSIHRTGNYYPQGGSLYSDDFVRLVGWLMTDGSIVTSNKEKGVIRRIVVYQSERKNPHKVKMIDEMFARLGANPSRRNVPRGGIQWLLFGGSSLARAAIDLFPARILNESFLLALTKEQLGILMETMLLGDGGGGSHKRLVCRSQVAADAFQLLCTLCGIATTSRSHIPIAPKKQYASMPNIPKRTKLVWIVTLLRRSTVQVIVHKRQYGKNTKAVNQVRRHNEARPVWCPVVRNTNFVARRRGDVFITQNTPIQQMVADIMNIRLLEMWPQIDGEVVMVGQHHDAAIFEAPEGKKADDLDQLIADTWAKPVVIPKSIVCEQEAEFVLPIDQHRGYRWADL